MAEYYSVTLDSETHLVSGKNNVPDEIAQYVFQRKWEHNEDKKLFSYFKGKGKDAVITDTEHPSHDQKHYGKNSFEYGNQRYYLTKMKWADSSFSVDFINEIKRIFGERFVIEQISKDKYDELKGYKKNSSKVASSHTKTDSTIPSSSTHVSQKTESNEEKDARDAKFRPEIEAARKQMVFCDEKIVETLNTSKIVNLLVGENGIFPDAMKNVLKERYLKMRCNFKKQWEKDDWTQKMPEGTFNIVHGSSDALLEVPASICQCTLTEKIFANATNIGHDLPIWLYYDKKDAQRRRVMIISQDPKRSGHSGHDLLLSTPWAHHSLNFLRNNANNAQMMAMRLIHLYLKNGDIVYLTDYRKLYWEPTKGATLTETHKDGIYKKILKEEIKYFSPDFIVTIGRSVSNAIMDEKVSLSHDFCPNPNQKIKVYAKYHTSAWASDNPHYNDPEYWYVAPSEEQGPTEGQNGFIASNDISKQGDEQ